MDENQVRQIAREELRSVLSAITNDTPADTPPVSVLKILPPEGSRPGLVQALERMPQHWIQRLEMALALRDYIYFQDGEAKATAMLLEVITKD